MPLPGPIIAVLMTFRPLFTAPTWSKLMILLTGTRLSQGCRTVGSRLALRRQQHGGELEQLPSGAQPSPLVAISGEPPPPASHCRDLCAGRGKRGSGDR